MGKVKDGKGKRKLRFALLSHYLRPYDFSYKQGNSQSAEFNSQTHAHNQKVMCFHLDMLSGSFTECAVCAIVTLTTMTESSGVMTAGAILTRASSRTIVAMETMLAFC